MPRIVDHPAYRAELLDGCLEPAARGGYQGLTMRGVADELGVSTGTLYHYFAGKRDLYTQLVEHLTDRLVEEIEGAVTSAPTPRGRLAALLDDVAAHERWYAQYERVCLDGLPGRGAEDTRLMARAMARTVDVLASTLDLDASAGRFVFVFVFGLVLERDLDGGATPLPEQATVLLEWFDALPAGRRAHEDDSEPAVGPEGSEQAPTRAAATRPPPAPGPRG